MADPRPLRIGTSLTWPAAMASQAIGLLGVRGAGKSNLARVMAEECYHSEIPFVVFDPIGNWSGIRAGRDGKPKGGLPIPIFGGEHGDLPIQSTAGAKIADLVIEKRLSCILDLSHPDFSEADKRRFLAEFTDRLFRKKSRESGWLMLILEEADDYAPQSPRGPQVECLVAFQKIVKRGRFKGLGALIVTQRSSAINKDLLNMIGTLVAFRTTAPHDREAIEKWLKAYQQSDKLMKDLPSLPSGTALVWSPEFLNEIGTYSFRRMETFDTGATPEHKSGGAAPATLIDIDVPALNKELEAAVEKAKAEDPRLLRKKIADLEREVQAALRMKTPAAAPAPKAEVKRVQVPVFKEGHIVRLEAVIERAVKSHENVMVDLLQLRERLKEAFKAPALEFGWNPPATAWQKQAVQARRPAAQPRPAVQTRRDREQATVEGVTPAKQKILDALLFISQTLGHESGSRSQVAMLSDQSPKSGGFRNYLSELKVFGLIEYPSAGRIALTPAGRGLASSDGAPQTTAELHERLEQRVTPAKWKIVEVLTRAYPDMVDRETLAGESNQSASSGGFRNYLSELKGLGFITYPSTGFARAADELFIE